jgi:hypothetical protein
MGEEYRFLCPLEKNLENCRCEAGPASEKWKPRRSSSFPSFLLSLVFNFQFSCLQTYNDHHELLLSPEKFLEGGPKFEDQTSPC